MVHTFNPSTQKTEVGESKVSLVYRASDTEKTVSKKPDIVIDTTVVSFWVSLSVVHHFLMTFNKTLNFPL